MQTATQTYDPFAAYENVLQEHDAQATAIVTNNDSLTHYVWHVVDPIPFGEVVSGWIQRGQVTPILPFPKWERWEDVPEGMRARVRGEQMMGGTTVPAEAQYYLAPNPIFEDLIDKYAVRGVVELTALRGWPKERVRELDIDNVFFPDGVPVRYSDIKKALDEAGARLKGGVHFETYKAIYKDMLRAVDQAIFADNKYVDDVESWIEMSKSNPGYQSSYDATSVRAMGRLERTRKDHAINLTQKFQQESATLNTEILKTIAANQQSGLTAETLAEALAIAFEKAAEMKEKKAAKQTSVEAKK